MSILRALIGFFPNPFAPYNTGWPRLQEGNIGDPGIVGRRKLNGH